MRRNLPAVIWVLVLALLILAGCVEMPTVTPAATGQVVLATPMLAIAPCEACDRATIAAILTQGSNNSDYQAAAAAEIVRVNAQATLDSANATLNAVATQEKNNANIIAAQIAATAEIVRANAQATLNSAGATQNAARNQDAIRETQARYDLQVTQAVGTQSAYVLMTQQNKNDLAAGTQTAIANNIATQTQVAAATSQWYAEQTRQREEQRQGPIAFLWMWCFPFFIVLLAGLIIWGLWRWLKIQQANQRILEKPVEKLPVPPVEVPHHHHDNSLPYLEGDFVDDHYQIAKPDDQVHQWLDEIKNELLENDRKEDDDNPDN